MLMQMDLFEDNNDTDILMREIDGIRESNDKVRKSLFSRHAELAKRYIELHNRLEILERNICHGKD